MRLSSLNLKTISIALFALAMACGKTFAQESFPFSAEVNAEKINLRADSTTNSSVICTLDKGQKLEVVFEQYGWYKVRLPKTVPVYIKKGLSECFNYETPPTGEITSVAKTQKTKKCLNAKIAKDRVNIRLSPSESANILGKVNINEVVNIIEESNGWVRIEAVNNSFGWVNAKFLTKTSASAPAVVTQTFIPEKAEPKMEPQEISLIGTVKPYGMIFKRKATHKLITKDDKVFLLKGNKESLDALNNKKVKVTGTIINLQEKFPIIEIKELEVAN